MATTTQGNHYTITVNKLELVLNADGTLDMEVDVSWQLKDPNTVPENPVFYTAVLRNTAGEIVFPVHSNTTGYDDPVSFVSKRSKISVEAGEYTFEARAEVTNALIMDARSVTDPITVSSNVGSDGGFSDDIVYRNVKGEELTWNEGDNNLKLFDLRTKTNRDRLDLLVPRMDKAEADISANAASILSNNQGLYALSVKIVENKTAIADNLAKIQKNIQDIGLNKTATESNALAISSNTTAIENNKTVIDQNVLDIAANKTATENNAQGIGANALEIGKNTTEIGNLNLAINQNSQQIQNLSGSISSNSQLLGQNLTKIFENATAISDNKKAIENAKLSITSNSNLISANSGEINTIKQNITDFLSKVLANTSNITKNTNDIKTLQDGGGDTAGLKSRMDTAEGKIDANRSALDAFNAKDLLVNLRTQATELRGDLSLTAKLTVGSTLGIKNEQLTVRDSIGLICDQNSDQGAWINFRHGSAAYWGIGMKNTNLHIYNHDLETSAVVIAPESGNVSIGTGAYPRAVLDVKGRIINERAAVHKDISTPVYFNFGEGVTYHYSLTANVYLAPQGNYYDGDIVFMILKDKNGTRNITYWTDNGYTYYGEPASNYDGSGNGMLVAIMCTDAINNVFEVAMLKR